MYRQTDKHGNQKDQKHNLPGGDKYGKFANTSLDFTYYTLQNGTHTKTIVYV